MLLTTYVVVQLINWLGCFSVHHIGDEFVEFIFKGQVDNLRHHLYVFIYGSTALVNLARIFSSLIYILGGRGSVVG
jgi:hypothetical protein